MNTRDAADGQRSIGLKPRRVLVFAGEFSTSAQDRWLLDDIVDEFVDQGVSVDVLVFDNKRVRPRSVTSRREGRIRVISVGPEAPSKGSFRKVLSRVVSAGRLHAAAHKLLSGEIYDLGLFTSVAAMSAGVPRRLRASGTVKTLAFIQWDFFPVHQIEIGRLPGHALIRLLRRLEYFNIATSDVVAVMSPANETFFRRYFPWYKGRIVIIPPWARADRAELAPKTEEFTAIFGGQLVPGRGVEAIIRAAHLLEVQGRSIRIIIAGDGSSRPAFEALAASLAVSSVSFLGSIPRPHYRQLLQTVHVGIAATVTGVSVPAFPSKIVEYCGASIPVVACLDTASDGGDLLLEYGAGLVVNADDEHALADALLRLEARHQERTLGEMSAGAKRLFESRLSAKQAAKTLLGLTRDDQRKRDGRS